VDSIGSDGCQGGIIKSIENQMVNNKRERN